jgi:hypothetical protein
MAANQDEPRSKLLIKWAEPLALIFSIVAIPALAIALGIGIVVLVNALR